MSSAATVVINVSTTAYAKGQERLEESIKRSCGDTVKLVFYRNVMPPGSPTHTENPYAFKPYAFIDAVKRGHTKIFWCDASCVVIRGDLSPMFRHGYYLQNDGWKVSQWVNQSCLDYFGLTRAECEKITMFVAGCFTLDMSLEICQKFLAEWKKAADSGAFKGSWKDHRHDMTCGSIIAHRLGMKLSEDGFIVSGPYTGKEPQHVLVKLHGIC
jgi:hypothetical protein